MRPSEQEHIPPPGEITRLAVALDRTRLVTRTLLWALLLICAALLVATLSEAWQRHTLDEQVAAARAQNAALHQQILQTQHAITVAESPATIEREARSWGYVRSGDHPVIVVSSPTK